MWKAICLKKITSATVATVKFLWPILKPILTEAAKQKLEKKLLK